MIYDGKREYNSRYVDAWYSDKRCPLFGGSPRVSCFVLFTHPDSSIPLYHQLAYSKKAIYEEDWVIIEHWHDYKDSAPPINPPRDWLTNSYNLQNGLLVEPLRGYVAVPGGDDNFTIALTAPPVNCLGDVVVKFNSISLGCTVVSCYVRKVALSLLNSLLHL